jgi:ABC-2 type transport system permease protein
MGVVLGNIIAIYRRELQSYFVSPLAYIVAGFFWLIAGLSFISLLLGPPEVGIINTVAVEDLQRQQVGVPAWNIDVPYEFVRAFFDSMGSLLFFVLPFLSMGLYSEERRRGTLELLATSPITNWAVAVGKLLGIMTFVTTITLPMVVLTAIALSGSDSSVPIGMLLRGHLGLILLSGSLLSLGMFISSLTDSTVLSGIITWATNALLFFFELEVRKMSGPVGEFLGYMLLQKHLRTMAQGIFDTSSLILFASYIILGIFLTSQSIDALRFQRQ